MALNLVPEAAIRAASRVIEAQMTSRCQITRESPGQHTPDYVNFTAVEAEVDREVIYDGPCYFGDRVEGSLTTGGFGANAQESAYDARQHSVFLRLPLGGAGDHVRVGDVVWVPLANGDRYRVTAREQGTHKVTNTFRMARFDVDQSRS